MQIEIGYVWVIWSQNLDDNKEDDDENQGEKDRDQIGTGHRIGMENGVVIGNGMENRMRIGGWIGIGIGFEL